MLYDQDTRTETEEPREIRTGRRYLRADHSSPTTIVDYYRDDTPGDQYECITVTHGDHSFDISREEAAAMIRDLQRAFEHFN